MNHNDMPYQSAHQHVFLGKAHDDNARRTLWVLLLTLVMMVAEILVGYLTGSMALLAGRYLGLHWLDPLMGLVGAYVIARWAVALIRDTAQMLLDTTDAPVAAAIRRKLGELAGLQLADLHVWKVGPQACAAIVSVVAPADVSVQQIRAHLTDIDDLAHLSVEIA